MPKSSGFPEKIKINTLIMLRGYSMAILRGNQLWKVEAVGGGH
jgi:hypothetical protein